MALFRCGGSTELSSYGGWVRQGTSSVVDFGSPTLVAYLYHAAGGTSSNPSSATFKIQGSSDGSTFVDVATETGSSYDSYNSYGTGQTSTPYRYIRCIASASSSGYVNPTIAFWKINQ